MFLRNFVFERTWQMSKKRIADIMKNPDNYGSSEEQWSFTQITRALKTDGNEKRKAELCLASLDGLEVDGKRHHERAVKWNGTAPVFRLRVLSRQACHEDKDGNRLWWRQDAKQFNGTESDIVVSHDDAPVAGDIVRCKIDMEPFNDEGKRMSTSDQEALIHEGREITNYNRFDVDKNSCITVGYPDVMMLLNKNGERLAFPQFQKMDRRNKADRKITNWLFREVFSQKRGRKPITQGASNEPSTTDAH